MNDFCESVKRYLIKLCPKHSQNDQYAMRNETHSLWGGGGGGEKKKKKKKKTIQNRTDVTITTSIWMFGGFLLLLCVCF